MTFEEALKFAPLASALVGCLAAIIAAVSTIFACIQMRLARRNAVLQALQSFSKSVEDREAALSSAKTATEKQHSFHEFMNFIELYAGICNRKLVSGLAHELIRDRLVDSVVVIERTSEWHDVIDRAIFHEDTFAELGTFMKRNTVIVAARRVAAQQRAKNINTIKPDNEASD